MSNKKRLHNLRKFSADAAGVVAGIDSSCNSFFYYGGALGYTHTDLLWKNQGGGSTMNSYYGSFYGSCLWEYFHLDFSAIGGATDNDVERQIAFGSINRKAQSDFWNYFLTTHLEGAVNFCCNSWFNQEIFALFDYHYFNHGSFKESGADSLNLRVKSKDQHMARVEAGFKWSYERICDCFCYAPYFGFSWVGESALDKSKQPASFKGQSCVIKATSYEPGDHMHFFSVQTGFKWTRNDGFSFGLGYKGIFNKISRINEGEGRLEWLF